MTNPTLVEVRVAGKQGSPGMTWRGAWSSAANYVARDAVSHGNRAWIALASSTNAAPGTDPLKWEVMIDAPGLFRDFVIDDANPLIDALPAALKVNIDAAGGGDTTTGGVGEFFRMSLNGNVVARLRKTGALALAGMLSIGAVDGAGNAPALKANGVVLEARLDNDAGLTSMRTKGYEAQLGTITADAQALTLSGTYNNVGVQFGGLVKVNLTDTASHAESLVADISINAVSLLRLRKDGRLTIGGNAPSNDNTAFLAARAVTGDSIFAHGYRDESTQNFTTDGAYCSFDANPVFGGSAANYNHLHGFQDRLTYSSSGTIGEVAGFTSVPTINGPVTNRYGARISDALGSGAIATNYGIRIEALSRGSANYAIWTAGTTPSYFGGLVQIGGGTTVTLSVTTLASYSASAGSGATPAFNFNSDPDTGMLSDGANILAVATAGSTRWQWNASGHYVAKADGVYDIGQSSSQRPNNVYAVGNMVAATFQAQNILQVGGTGSIRFASQARLKSSADGIMSILNAAETGFDSLLLGPSGTTYTRIKHAGTGLGQYRLSNDSNFASFQAKLRTHANAVAETPPQTHTVAMEAADGTAIKVLCALA